MNNKLKTPEMDTVLSCGAVFAHRRRNAMRLEDICTVSELLAIAQSFR